MPGAGIEIKLSSPARYSCRMVRGQQSAANGLPAVQDLGLPLQILSPVELSPKMHRLHDILQNLDK